MPKALVEYEGSLLVERAVRTAAAVCDPVLVVLGARAVDVWRTADLGGATVLANPDWETGMASSLRTGLDGLRGWPARIDAALLLLVDMPGMTPAALARMADHSSPRALAAPAPPRRGARPRPRRPRAPPGPDGPRPGGGRRGAPRGRGGPPPLSRGAR